jgi:hypothetical protein
MDISERALRRNEEAPHSQAEGALFDRVLRKKHAFQSPLETARRGGPPAHSGNHNSYVKTMIYTKFGDVSGGPLYNNLVQFKSCIRRILRYIQPHHSPRIAKSAHFRGMQASLQPDFRGRWPISKSLIVEG